MIPVSKPHSTLGAALEEARQLCARNSFRPTAVDRGGGSMTSKQHLELHQTIYDGLMKGDDGDSAPFIALTRLVEQYQSAQREADIQLGEKLAAQMTLKAVCDALDLPMVSLGNGWTEATPKILARIEEIVDEGERESIAETLEYAAEDRSDYLPAELLDEEASNQESEPE